MIYAFVEQVKPNVADEPHAKPLQLTGGSISFENVHFGCVPQLFTNQVVREELGYFSFVLSQHVDLETFATCCR